MRRGDDIERIIEAAVERAVRRALDAERAGLADLLWRLERAEHRLDRQRRPYGDGSRPRGSR